MRIIAQHILDKIRAHSCHWSLLPEVTIPSAAVSDDDIAEWSQELYDRDLANESQPRPGW